jgi:hypothetical protein
MSDIRIFSKLLQGSGDLARYITQNFIQIINKNFFSKKNIIQQNISSIVIESIKAQPEYSSLKSGVLRNQFGIANVSVVDSILSELDDIQVQLIKPRALKNGIEASLIVNMIKEGFPDILGSSGASYVSEKGSQIDWLRWLLLEGNNSVVVGYKYFPKADPRSRTGKGIMIKGESAIYRVPPEFAGTAENNWITRGINEALPQIESYINQMVQKSL